MTVLHGDSLLLLPTLDAESVDAIVCDPPYGLAFMGKAWDHGVPGAPFWREALRVARPGAYLVAFGGTRTYHRLACAIEDAGWEIRDCLSWLYGSGFPKSHNGPWGGTALKPAWEPIILARKPLIGMVAANVAAHGTGGINVEGCRIGTDATRRPNGPIGFHGGGSGGVGGSTSGRWPANVVLDEDAAAMLDAQSGERKSGSGNKNVRNRDDRNAYGKGLGAGNGDGIGGDTGGASRFFYTAKASRREREAGLEGMPEVEREGQSAWTGECNACGCRMMLNGKPTCGHDDFRWVTGKPTRNAHPTVKPIALMRWLCRLVTPNGGLILDPFTGSGTTGCAAALEGFRFVGIEREAEYVEIATKRIAHWAAERATVVAEEAEAAAQGSLFDPVRLAD